MTVLGCHRGERGSAATELVLAAPLLIVLLLFVAFGGRLVMARGEIDAAARDAARAASIARDRVDAEAAARTAATAATAGRTVPCNRLAVAVDTGSFRAGGTVSVALTCNLKLSDLALFGIPGSRTLTARSTAPVDVYRGTR